MNITKLIANAINEDFEGMVEDYQDNTDQDDYRYEFHVGGFTIEYTVQFIDWERDDNGVYELSDIDIRIEHVLFDGVALERGADGYTFDRDLLISLIQ